MCYKWGRVKSTPAHHASRAIDERQRTRDPTFLLLSTICSSRMLASVFFTSWTKTSRNCPRCIVLFLKPARFFDFSLRCKSISSIAKILLNLERREIVSSANLDETNLILSIWSFDRKHWTTRWDFSFVVRFLWFTKTNDKEIIKYTPTGVILINRAVWLILRWISKICFSTSIL